jgi:hypothetical protein
MKISKNFLVFWIIKVLYFFILNLENKLKIVIARGVFLPSVKNVYFFRRFFRCGGGDGF